MKKLLIILFIAAAVLMLFCAPDREKFSASGMAVSDEYCRKLADVYYRPKIRDIECRDDYFERICGKKRRNTIDFRTGNYFTQSGILV